MKIFSLETKKHLVGWCLGLGLILDFIVQKLSAHSCDELAFTCYGFPISIKPFNDDVLTTNVFVLETVLNLIFWIIVVIIILSLIRHFKYRKTDINPASASNQR